MSASAKLPGDYSRLRGEAAKNIFSRSNIVSRSDAGACSGRAVDAVAQPIGDPDAGCSILVASVKAVCRNGRYLALCCALLAPAVSTAAPTFEADVQPFLEKHCILCHNAQVKTADLLLDSYKNDEAARYSDIWKRVKRMLGTGRMPPAGRPRPARQDVANVLDWITANTAEETISSDPGRVTARRLNRAEYNNTVRDLLGIYIRPADDFPVDDSGYGFDNIGDVLSVSSVLMEKYMAAAGKISRRAVMTDRVAKPTLTRYSAPQSAGERRQIGSAARLSYSPEGRLTVPHVFPATGEYELRLGFVDRRHVQPRRPEWVHRIPEIIDKVSVLGRRIIDRETAREKLQILLEDSSRFMRKFGARRQDETYVVEREKLLAGLGEYEIWLKENPEPPEPPPPPPLDVVFDLDGERLITYLAADDDEYERPEPVRLRVEAGERELHGEILSPEGERWNPNSLEWAEYRGPTTLPAKRMVFVDYVEVKGPYDADPAPLPESHRRMMVCSPAGKNFDGECAEQIIARVLRLAFRRPVSASEVGNYVRFARRAVKAGASFERGIQVALKAILVSPHFLFRVEHDPHPAGPGLSYQISDFELASRLSYFLWSSMPDQELLAAAEAGDLGTAKGRKVQVTRMVRDEKFSALVENFAGQWLELRNIALAKPDPEIFPEFDEDLREAMVRETELFFANIVEEDRSVLDFLKADYTFVNERLAEHYGIDGVSGPEFRKVPLAGGQRGGVLTQASVLTVSSYPTRTSPVLRGLWVLDNLLGDRPPDPPGGVPELDEKTAGKAASLRQQLEKHRADPGCAVCHDRMDPLGFGLENYNAIGAWRTADGNFPIDASGELPGGIRFNGPAELNAVLYERGGQFARNLTEKMLTYALGRGLERYDKPVVEKIRNGMAENGYRFSSLLLGIVESMAFRMRRPEGGD